MASRKQLTTGAGLIGLALLMAGCSSGGSAAPTTTAAGTPTTAASKTADTAVTTVTNLSPACPGSGSPASSDAVHGGGTHTYYTLATTDYASVVTNCNSALTAAGWTVASTGNNGYGRYGGGGSTVTKGARYAVFAVGSSGSRTYMDVCVWPSRPANTNCGQNSNDNDNDNQNGSNSNDNDNDNQNNNQNNQNNNQNDNQNNNQN
jgi:hypothetical protein